MLRIVLFGLFAWMWSLPSSGMSSGISAAQSLPAADTMAFWDSPRRGGNSFNRLPPDQAYFDALRGHGADWVRLSYDKWQGSRRDFLLGDASRYQALVPHDLAMLRATLDRAAHAGLKVVVAPLSLPHARWKQNNGGAFDDRLWQDRRHWRAAAQFWRDLAQALRGHPALAAYNIINEPAPEYRGGLREHAPAAHMQQWYARVRGSARDLPAFYAEMIAAIRGVDDNTPVMVDAGWYAAADAFVYWPGPLADARVLYSFHMYEPYDTTSAPNARRPQPQRYPGVSRFGGGRQHWDAARVRDYLAQPFDWARRHGIAPTRMVAGEFGCIRTLDSCTRYLDDVLTVLEAQGGHWAFYAFREDNWDAMDYELGQTRVPWAYWQAIEQGRPDPVRRSETPLAPEFGVIRRRLLPAQPDQRPATSD